MLRIAILDDYQDVALSLADWTLLGNDCEIVRFDRNLASEDEAAASLAGFDVLCLMRERMPLSSGLIERLPHSNTYTLTDDGQRFAIFYSKVHNRLLRPLLAANQPPAPLEVRQALRVLDNAITDYINDARIAA